MLEAFSLQKSALVASHYEVVLTFQERQKSRHKCETTCGKTLGWFLERGHVLKDGDFLQCSNDQTVRVVAAPETVSQIESSDTLLLTRAAYHLGNRHVPLQIGSGFLRYQHDHVYLFSQKMAPITVRVGADIRTVMTTHMSIKLWVGYE